MSITSIDDHRGRRPGPPTVPRDRPTDDGGDPRKRFAIDVNHEDLEAQAAIAWKAMEADNDPPQWFRVGRALARLVSDDGTVVAPDYLTVDSLRYASARNAFWFKTTKDGQVWKHPSETVIKDMLVAPNPPLPRLNRVIYAPVFGADGSLSVESGYNPITLNFYADGGFLVTPPSAHPSKVQVEAAKKLILDDLLGDFPFASDADRAHAVSLLLNPFVRDLVDGFTPLYMIESPTPGTGKGLLAEVAMIPALNRLPNLLSPTNHQEEFKKTISTTLFAIPEAVLIDNVPDSLDSHHLASALTMPEWTGRVLGFSKERTVPIRCTWIATGNNPMVSPEMDRRVIRIRLDAKAERPEERGGFRHADLIRWTRDHRGEIVAACLTLVQAWVAGGMKESSHILGSYGSWARIHGGILKEIEIPGFLANRDEGRGVRVTESSYWGEFVSAWWKEYREKVVTVGDLYQLASAIDEFPLGKRSDMRSQKIFFGLQMRKKLNAIYDGREIQAMGKAQNAMQYRLMQTREVPF